MPSTSAEGARRVAVAGLRRIARGLDAAAVRAVDPAVKDERSRAAAQLRFVAVSVAAGGHDELAGVWLVAGRRILAGYDRADRAERVG